MAPENSHYAPLSRYDAEEGEALHINSPTDIDGTLSPPAIQLVDEPRAATHTVRRWEWLTRSALVLLSVIFISLWATSASTRKCTYVEKYSPVNEAVEYIEQVKYKGALHATSPWRGDESVNPSSEIDAAWRRISTDVKPISVTEEQLHKMGMAVTQTTVKVPEEEGGGYLVSLEVAHHFRCLDMLRKATLREYYGSFDPIFQIEEEILMNQLDTCVDILRQALMCYPDLNIVAYYWIHGNRLPFGDANTIHRCRSFEKIIEWAAGRSVDVPHVLAGLRGEKAAVGATSGM